MEGEYDVVHLHFPEYLTYEIQDAYHKGLTDALIASVAERLHYWADRARIVVTRHVLLPHDITHLPAWERMYETVYSYADGVVHFGHPSIDEFCRRYEATAFKRGRPPAHVVIPHQNYASLASGIDRSEARRMLRIPQDAHVMLVFGAIRSDKERDLILSTFKGLTGKKVLLASRWRENPVNVSWIRLQRWIRNARRLYYSARSSYRLNYSFVPEEEAQKYLAAADVLFIPRLRVLNSGNIALGMTFGRVVVGPDSLDVGDTLKSTGNPVFNPDDPATAIVAVMEGFRLADENLVGPANRDYALTEWDVHDCAASYNIFFESLVINERNAGALT
jgi:hypothetical protein